MHDQGETQNHTSPTRCSRKMDGGAGYTTGLGGDLGVHLGRVGGHPSAES